MSGSVEKYSPPPVPFERQLQLADAFAKSGLFGIKTRDQALSLMAICESEGIHPARAAQEYHVISGRPALKADAMLSRFLTAGGKVKWLEYTDQKVAATFSHPQSGEITIDWTMERATAAGLTGKDNWKSYPRQMLRARVISEGVRTIWPGVSVGIYTPEEVMDMQPIEAAYEVVNPDPRPSEVQGQPTASELPPGRQNRQGDRLASEAQVSFIRTLAQERGIARDQIYAQFKINQSLQEELLASEVDEVIAWLKSFAKLDDSDKLRF